MVIVDSSVWIDYFNDKQDSRTEWLEAAIGQAGIGLTSLILCEVLQGIRHERSFRLTHRQLTSLLVFEGLGTGLAVASAENFRYLQRQGVTIRSTIECIIATFCIENGHRLLHHDRDFDPFEEHLGLLVLHPPAIAFN
jgi:hypothetical protein